MNYILAFACGFLIVGLCRLFYWLGYADAMKRTLQMLDERGL